MGKRLDLTGQRFGRLIVIKFAGLGGSRSAKWLCQCDCGNKTISMGQGLRNGTTKSCGCLQKELVQARRRLPLGEAAFNTLYKTYIRNAETRGFVFDIPKDIFRIITSSNCYYCGRAPKQISKSLANGSYIYNGIDRIDNNIGYTLDNCVSCCGVCNFSKSTLSTIEFINMCRAVALLHPEG